MSLPSTEALTTGYFFSAAHRRLDEERHEAQLDAVLLLELVLVLVAQVHHRLHVDLVEGGQDRVGRLRLQQALGDARAQAGHRHALLRSVGQVPSGRAADLRQRAWQARRRSGQGARRGLACRRGHAQPSTSPLVTRPSLPVPATWPASCRCRPAAWLPQAWRRRPSSRRLRPAPQAVAAGGRCAAAARRGRRGSGRLALASVSIVRDHFAADDGAAVGLDDLDDARRPTAPALRAPPCRSRSRSGFRRCPTASPSFLCHCSRVASATDSDSCGTLTSMIAMSVETP